MAYKRVVFGSVLPFLILCGTASAQTDRVYVDSVEAVPGSNVSVEFYLENTQSLFAVTIPITYDDELLSLTDISLDSSRGAHVSSIDIVPSDLSTSAGHFLLAFISFQNDSIPPGDGNIFTATFSVAGDAAIGSTMSFDTLFYPPGGEFIFVDSTAGIIYPEFDGGLVTVIDPNTPPEFVPTGDQSVSEGDSLTFAVEATDVDGDSLILFASAIPNGAVFEDQGDGTGLFDWQPEFVGPGSSKGSPFTLVFGATDGSDTVTHSVSVTVTNVNRAPTITIPDTAGAVAGDTVAVSVQAADPDFEQISWVVSGLPLGASFSYNNPGEFFWASTVTDEGIYDIEFIASDPLGAADTGVLTVQLNPATAHFFSIDSATGWPGETVTVTLSLKNTMPLAGFNLLLAYDDASLIFDGVDNSGTRSQDFERFEVTDGDGGIDGHLRLIGMADESGGATISPIGSGEGAVAHLTFEIVGGLNLGGYNVPLQFVFLSPPNDVDNTVIDANGDRIPSSLVGVTGGLVEIESLGVPDPGDINLNNVTYDIGDATLFANYLIDPATYSLSPLQIVNTNVNGDSFVATVADFVTLINIIASGGASSVAPARPDLRLKVLTANDNEGTTIKYRSGFEGAGVLARFELKNTSREVTIENLQPHMEMVTARRGNELRAVWYSRDGGRVPSGEQALAGVETSDGVVLKSIQMGLATGGIAEAVIEEQVPHTFRLSQNHPNPFNPETQIAFSLPSAGRATLTIYNILGHVIKNFEYNNLPAGRHEVVWDGRNANGQPVASGVYLYRLTTGAGSLTRKMMLVK